MAAQDLQRTPFYDLHVSLRGKMVPFAGFEMPVQYPEGITHEHHAVRKDLGVFDVSHMGEFEFSGPDRNAWVNRLTCNDVSAIADGEAQYTALINQEGTFIDDCIVYRFDDKIMMVVNASNLGKDWNHVVSNKSGVNARVKNISDDVALLAVQGPRSEDLLQSLTRISLGSLKYYAFEVGQVAGVQCFAARTGYTGEDGFELYFRPADAETMWHALVGQGRGTPCGLGARDSLRLEAGYALYGNDIDDTVNPYEARLGWIVKLDKGAPFVGDRALRKIKGQGATRRLIGFTCEARGAIPRPGYDVLLNGHKVDTVRSGGFSPSLKIGVGTTYLPTHSVDPGTSIEIVSRGRQIQGTVVKMPFYKEGSVKRK